MSNLQRMMTKKKLLLLFSLFIFVLFSIRTTWYTQLAKPNHFGAVSGVLDLRGFDFSSDETITMNGEWEFYPLRLFIPAELKATNTQKNRSLTQVPGKWVNSLHPDHSTNIGYGTYRLRVLVTPDSSRTFSMRLPGIVSTSALYVNGQLLARSGYPADSPEKNISQVVPKTVSFTTDKSELDIVIQVANYENKRQGGIIRSIKIGSDKAIEKEKWFSISMQIFVVVVMALHAVYVCMLYLIGIRQKPLLSFLMLILSALIMTVVDDDKLLFFLFPLPYEWNIKLAYVSFVGVAAFLLSFAKSLVYHKMRFPLFRLFNWICTLCAISILLTSASTTLLLSSLYFCLPLLASLILLVQSLRTSRRNDSDAIFLGLGVTSIMTNVVGGFIKAIWWPDIGYYPIDLIVAFLMFASYWFKRYFRASIQTAQLAAKLQEADKRKDIFLANTSHELRNPLHGMITIAQSVLEEWDQPHSTKGKENLELLITVGKRMSHVLNDLLDIARLQENGVHLHTRELKLQAMAAGVTDMLRFMLDGKPIQLITDIPDRFPEVVADENRLSQILFNLLHNAVKYTNEGTISISATLENGKAKISVRDTGIGMDEETQKRIFLPYEQGISPSADSTGGIGLGLSITKQLVELHGGTIAVHAVPSQGSHFFFTLPLAKKVDGAASEENEPVHGEIAATTSPLECPSSCAETFKPTGDRPSLLIVDDDPINLTVLMNILSPEQYEITKVTKGKDALCLLESREWDLVISDVMMPGMSGYELSRMIRERFTLSELPILLLTARSQPEDIQTGFLSGANDYVTKPVDTEELRSRVRALTEMKKSARERLRMEAAWLQAQIQPHFLFNTLNAIAALHLVDPKRMNALLVAFGNYLKTSFDFANSGRFVPLSHELVLVRSYLYIEKERFEERLEVVWDVDESLSVQIPPLSIQPLVENAIRHGIMKRIRGGVIQIKIVDSPDHVAVTVADDGVGMDEDTLLHLFDPKQPSSSGVGVRNTDRRLKQLYGKGLQIQSTPDQGTTVTFTVSK